MARMHGGGFIPEDFYWDIGTPERGRDGMNARDAAKRYNDHRHTPITLETDAEVKAWLTETQQRSFTNSRAGGIITDNAAGSMRAVGDTATHQGLLWVYGPNRDLIPLGVGAGCYIDANGVFHREVKYDVIQMVSGQEVSATDEPVSRPGGDAVDALGDRVGSYTLDASRYATARSAPAMYFRVTGSLIPTREALNHPDYSTLIQQFPHRATVKFRRLPTTIEGNTFFTSGIPESLEVYGDNSTLIQESQVSFSQPGGGQVTVADSRDLALDLDELTFLQAYASVHHYTDDEISTTNPVADMDAVRVCSSCTLDLMSVTLEIEGLLGISPFINEQGTRYTTRRST